MAVANNFQILKQVQNDGGSYIFIQSLKTSLNTP